MGLVPPWSSLVFNVKIIHLNSPAIEAEKIQLANMDLSAYTMHSSGLYYKFNNDTIGLQPQATDTVYAWYQCKLPDGTAVEESAAPNSPIDISGGITPALKEGLMLMSSGRKASFVAPSPLGYGKKGSSAVKPYQTLLYEVRLDSIR